MHGGAAQTRERGRACFAALPGEERFAYVFGSLIFLNKQFLCTEKAKKKFLQPLLYRKAFFGEGGVWWGPPPAGSPFGALQGLSEPSSSELGEGDHRSEP